MKWNFLYLIALLFFISCSTEQLKLTSNNFQIEINDKGQITSLFDLKNQMEYSTEDQTSYLLSLRSNGVMVHPDKMAWDEGNTLLILEFHEIMAVAHIKVRQKQLYSTFELVKIEGDVKSDLAIWGPFSTTINKVVGETVGVVRNDDFAIGIQALNPKTLGGYPTNEDDTEPAYDIFASNNLVDVGDSVKVLYRGQTAKHTEFGSVLQAYCRNREEDRVIKVWGHENYFVPAFEDGGLSGTKIALFGCENSKALETIGKIEIAEGLPHPTINGEWAKTARRATASYLIMSFNEANLDDAIELTKKAGLDYLYHGGPFKTWGHFVLNGEAFPDNWQSMRRCVDRAKAEGIKLGVHTLSNFITTNDRYVSPVPDERLAKVGESVLVTGIDAGAEEITIESPLFFNQMENNSLHSVVVGDEIIRYREVSESEPWKLIGCVRGAFNTQASAHQKGAKIGKLMDHGYKVFLSNAELSDEISKNIARLFNETGLRQISFDGLEGVWSTGMGQYARSLFTKTWFDNLKPELQGRVINDASNPSHYNWHINTRYNWGEPWYAGFRESQTKYRLMNQDFYRRNLLPSMLGWFSMSAQTSLEDAEWLLARAAGFDAGFALNVSFDDVEKNGQSEAIFEAINAWETARMAGAFTPEQKLKMEDISNEFHLVPVSEKSWMLFQYALTRFEHHQKVRQPGEPVHSTFKFENLNHSQALQFIITAPKESAISGLSFDIDNFKKIKFETTIPAGYHLKFEGGSEATVFTPEWEKVKTISVDRSQLEIAKGIHNLAFDCQFAKGIENVVKIEMKTMNDGDKISIE